MEKTALGFSTFSPRPPQSPSRSGKGPFRAMARANEKTLNFSETNSQKNKQQTARATSLKHDLLGINWNAFRASTEGSTLVRHADQQQERGKFIQTERLSPAPGSANTSVRSHEQFLGGTLDPAAVLSSDGRPSMFMTGRNAFMPSTEGSVLLKYTNGQIPSIGTGTLASGEKVFEIGRVPHPPKQLQALVSSREAYLRLRSYWGLRFTTPVLVFKHLDIKKRNVLTAEDFARALEHAGFQLPDSEIIALMAIFHKDAPVFCDGEPAVSFPQFIRKLTGNEAADRTIGRNTSRPVYQPKGVAADGTRLSAPPTENVEWALAAAEMRDKLALLEEAFKLLDVHNTGGLSSHDVHKAILQVTGASLSDAQLHKLKQSCGNPEGTLDYQRLLNMATNEDAVRVKQGNLHIDLKLQPKVRMTHALTDHLAKGTDYRPRTLSGGQCHSLMKEALQKDHDEIMAAFLEQDPEKTGRLDCQEMWKVLTRNSINLSFDKFKLMLKGLGLDKSDRVNYRAFMKTFEKKVVHEIKPTFQQLIPEFVLAKVCLHIFGLKPGDDEKMTHFEQDLVDAAAPDGFVSKQKFRRILYKHMKVPMEDREFAMACVQFQNETEDAIDYQKYLAEFKKYLKRRQIHTSKEEETRAPSNAALKQLGHYHLDPKDQKKQRIPARFGPKSHFFSTARAQIDRVNALLSSEPVESTCSQTLPAANVAESLFSPVQQPINRQSRSNFAATTGHIPESFSPDGFDDTRFFNTFSPAEMFGETGDSRLSGVESLRAITPLERMQGKRPVTAGTALLSHRPPATNRPMKVSFKAASDAEFRLQAEIQAHWKTLQREFRQRDQNCNEGTCTGQVSPEGFVAAMKACGISPLSPSESAALAAKFGVQHKRGPSTVDYNRFLKSMLKNSKLMNELATSRTNEIIQESDLGMSQEDVVKIQSHWKDIRKSLKILDGHNSGKVHVNQMESTLNLYNIHISPSQMDIIREQFGADCGQKIMYDKFLQLQLKNLKR